MASTYRLSTADIPRREYRIPHLPASRPWRWLALGWADFRAVPVPSLIYGGVVAVLGLGSSLYLTAIGRFYLVPFFAAGFFILAPVLAVGLFSIAKLRCEGGAYSAAALARTLARNRSSIALMGLILLFFFLNWIMLSNLLFGGVFHALTPSWEQVRPLPVLLAESMPFLAVFGGIAALLAAVLFRMVAVALPMLVDTEVDALNAIFASWRAVGESPGAMTLWAALILALTVLGFLTFFAGLAVVLPWLAYGTWHAYRDALLPCSDAPGPGPERAPRPVG